jgi:hypothetical protein
VEKFSTCMVWRLFMNSASTEEFNIEWQKKAIDNVWWIMRDLGGRGHYMVAWKTEENHCKGISQMHYCFVKFLGFVYEGHLNANVALLQNEFILYSTRNMHYISIVNYFSLHIFWIPCGVMSSWKICFILSCNHFYNHALTYQHSLDSSEFYF